MNRNMINNHHQYEARESFGKKPLCLLFRPHLNAKKLIPFDPWNSEKIFRNEKVEECLTQIRNPR